MLPAPPVVLDGVDVLDDTGVESPIEGVRGVRLPGLRFEQVLDPPENNKQFTSKSMPMTKRSVEVKTVELSSQLERDIGVRVLYPFLTKMRMLGRRSLGGEESDTICSKLNEADRHLRDINSLSCQVNGQTVNFIEIQ